MTPGPARPPDPTIVKRRNGPCRPDRCHGHRSGCYSSFLDQEGGVPTKCVTFSAKNGEFINDDFIGFNGDLMGSTGILQDLDSYLVGHMENM